MTSEMANALEVVKNGVLLTIPLNDGNTITIKKVGVGKYEVKDALGTRKAVYLKYSGIKELLEKLYGDRK